MNTIKEYKGEIVITILAIFLLSFFFTFFLSLQRKDLEPQTVSSPKQQSDLYLLIKQQEALGNQVAIVGPDKLIIKVLRNK